MAPPDGISLKIDAFADNDQTTTHQMTGKHTACGAMLAIVGLGVLVVGIVAIAGGFDTDNATAASGAGADDGSSSAPAMTKPVPTVTDYTHAFGEPLPPTISGKWERSAGDALKVEVFQVDAAASGAATLTFTDVQANEPGEADCPAGYALMYPDSKNGECGGCGAACKSLIGTNVADVQACADLCTALGPETCFAFDYGDGVSGVNGEEGNNNKRCYANKQCGSQDTGDGYTACRRQATWSVDLARATPSAGKLEPFFVGGGTSTDGKAHQDFGRYAVKVTVTPGTGVPCEDPCEATGTLTFPPKTCNALGLGTGAGTPTICVTSYARPSNGSPLTDADCIGGGKDKPVTFAQAEAACTNNNMRLCTWAELKAGEGDTTGCGRDKKLIWTLDKKWCSANEHAVNYGSSTQTSTAADASSCKADSTDTDVYGRCCTGVSCEKDAGCATGQECLIDADVSTGVCWTPPNAWDTPCGTWLNC